MKTFLKIVAGLVGLVVVVVVVAAVAVPTFVDPNDYKQRIASEVEAATGRPLRIPGDIDLTVFPWLGVDLGTVELGNAAGFPGDVFARTERARVRVKLLPLLRREVQMDTVSVSGLELHLARDAQGNTNWSDLAAGSDRAPKRGSGDGSGQLAALAIGGLDVRDASLTWDDARSGQRYAVRQLSLQTEELNPGRPIAFSVEFDLEGADPALSGHVSAEGSLELDLQAQRVRVAGLGVQAELSAEAVPGGSARVTLTTDADVDLAAQTVALGGLRLEVPGLAAGAVSADLALAGEASGDLASGLYTLRDLALEATLSGDRLPGGSVRVDGGGNVSLDLNAQTVLLKGLHVGVPELTLEGISGSVVARATGAADLAAQTLLTEALEIEAKLAGEALPGGRLEATATGRLALDLPQDALSLEALRLDALGLSSSAQLRVSGLTAGPRFAGQIDVAPFAPRELLERLGQPPIETADPTALASAMLSASLEGTGTRLRVEPLKAKLDDSTLEGRVQVLDFARPALRFDLRLDRIDADRYLPPAAAGDGPPPATPASAGAAAAALPVEMLRALDVEGKLAIAQLRIANLRIANVKLGVKAKDGVIDMKPAEAALYGGRYSGALGLDVSGAAARVRLDEELSGVEFGPLLKALGVEGTVLDGARGEIRLSGTASGDPAKQVFRAKDLTLGADLKGEALPGGELDLTAAADVAADLGADTLTLESLKIASPYLRGSGRVSVGALRSAPEFQGAIALEGVEVRRLLADFGGTKLDTADPKALSSAALSTQFQGSTDSLKLAPVTIQLDDSKLEGDVAIPSFTGPALRFDLALDRIDLDRYLPPPPAGGQTPASPGAAAAGAAGVPVDTLRALDVDGRFRVGKLRVARLRVSEADLTLKAKDGLIRLNPATAKLYGGSYQGNLAVDATKNLTLVSIDERLAGVEVGPLLNDLRDTELVTGTGDITAKLTALGLDTRSMKETLGGKAQVRLNDGTIQGVNIARMLCSGFRKLLAVSDVRTAATSLLGSVVGTIGDTVSGGSGAEQTDDERTRFAAMSANVQVVDGIARTDDFSAESPLLRITGGGQASIPAETLDLGVDVALVGSCEGQGGALARDLSHVKVPVRITGPFDSPKVQPQFAQVAAQIGSGSDTQQRDQPLQQQQQQTAEQPRDVKEQAEEAVKGLLKGILGN